MTVVAQPQHPARLVGVLVRALAAFALLASAAYAVLYIVDNETRSAPAPPPAASDLGLPDGMVAIRPTDLTEWKDILGFEPVLANDLPSGVIDGPVYFMQPPSGEFGVAGHVRYAYEDGRPAISLIEQSGGLDVTSPMKAIESGGTRVHLVNLACGDIVIQAQMFFRADGPDAPDPAATTATASAFFDGLRAQCGG
jgi:hypothetical protein